MTDVTRDHAGLISKIQIMGGKDFESDEVSEVEILDFNGFDHAGACD